MTPNKERLAMIQICTTVPEDKLHLARTGVAMTEVDVKTTIGGHYLGVVETSDDGYMFTDSFGHMTTFLEGEDIDEVMWWIFHSINPVTKN